MQIVIGRGNRRTVLELPAMGFMWDKGDEAAQGRELVKSLLRSRGVAI